MVGKPINVYSPTIYISGNDTIKRTKCQRPTSGFAQRRREVQIEKVVRKSRRCAKPLSRWLQCGDSAVDNVEKELKIGQ